MLTREVTFQSPLVGTIDDEIIENSGSRWLLASPATIPSGNGPFAQNLVSLSHARLGSDIRVSMILDDGGAPNVVPMHVKAALGGSLLFARFRFTQDALPLNQFGLNSNENGSWGNKPFFPRRFAWSPEFYVTTGGPYIAQLRRPGTDPTIPWTLIPSFDDPPNDPGFPYILTEHLPPFDAPTGNCVCPLSQCNCTDGRPSYWCNDLPQECYVFNDTNNVIDGCETQVEGGCYDPAFHHAFYKVVPADDFDVWGPYSNIKLWVLSEYTRMWGIQVEEPTSPPNFTGIDPWPDMMLEDSGYRPVADPTRGTVYEKLASGYAELPSEPLATQKMPLPRAQLALDVFIPSSASGWVGDVQMSFELAAAGISESYVGYAGLSSLQKGVWSTVTFNVPVQWRQALLGDFPGARFRTFVNSAAGGVRVGALRFQGPPSSGSRAPHQARLSGVRTTHTLDFETSPGWTGTNVELATNSSTGQYAARVTSSGWIEMVSPSFFTSSLPAIRPHQNLTGKATFRLS